MAEIAGFRPEGVVRQRFLHRGEPSDVVLYALLATDPRPGPWYRPSDLARPGGGAL